MRKQIGKVLLLLVLFFSSTYLWVPPVIGAIIPDPQIKADLKAVFANPPHVQGYPYQELLQDAASRYGLPLPYVLAVARGESFFDPRAKSPKGAIGLMQVMPSTAASYGFKKEELTDPAKNIEAGVHYLADLYAQLQDPYLALAAYYCGPSQMDKGKFVLRKECDEYVHYIYSHLQKIVAGSGSHGLVSTGRPHRFPITWFDNFLDAKDFLEYLSHKLPDLQLDIFRTEVIRPDHVRYQYQILAFYEKQGERIEICRSVEKATGFSFCQDTE